MKRDVCFFVIIFAQSVRDEVIGFLPTFTDMVESVRRFGMTYRGVPCAGRRTAGRPRRICCRC